MSDDATPLPAGASVYLVDDNAQFRESVAWWIESLGCRVEAFGDPQGLLDRFEAGHRVDEPACLLLDVRMPQMSGLQLHEAVKARGIPLPVIYMTGHGDVPLAVEAMKKGAVTLLEKPFREHALEDALRLALSIATPAPVAAIDPGTDRNPTAMRSPSADGTDPGTAAFAARIQKLTVREREILQLVVDGKLNKTIADVLGISIKTVELHRSRVMAKMEAESLVALIKMVVSQSAGTVRG